MITGSADCRIGMWSGLTGEPLNQGTTTDWHGPITTSCLHHGVLSLVLADHSMKIIDSTTGVVVKHEDLGEEVLSVYKAIDSLIIALRSQCIVLLLPSLEFRPIGSHAADVLLSTTISERFTYLLYSDGICELILHENNDLVRQAQFALSPQATNIFWWDTESVLVCIGDDSERIQFWKCSEFGDAAMLEVESTLEAITLWTFRWATDDKLGRLLFCIGEKHLFQIYRIDAPGAIPTLLLGILVEDASEFCGISVEVDLDSGLLAVAYSSQLFLWFDVDLHEVVDRSILLDDPDFTDTACVKTFEGPIVRLHIASNNRVIVEFADSEVICLDISEIRPR